MALVADDAFKMDQVWDILQTRLIRRSVPVKNMKLGDVEPAASSTVRRKIELKRGIDSDAAREIVKFLKDQKLKKVQANIQGDQLRITSPPKMSSRRSCASSRAAISGLHSSSATTDNSYSRVSIRSVACSILTLFRSRSARCPANNRLVLGLVSEITMLSVYGTLSCFGSSWIWTFFELHTSLAR